MTWMGIDQSLSGTCCYLLSSGDEGQAVHVKPDSSIKGFERLRAIRDTVMDLIDFYEPEVVAAEEVMLGGNTRSGHVELIQLLGLLRDGIAERGYGEDRSLALTKGKLFLLQSSTHMKKVVLGNGATKKDTQYLLKVFEKTGKRFGDDNEADAYMHAVTAKLKTDVLTGQVDFDKLPVYQQEALLSKGVSLKGKGSTFKKAMKLPAAERLAFVVP